MIRLGSVALEKRNFPRAFSGLSYPAWTDVLNRVTCQSSAHAGSPEEPELGSKYNSRFLALLRRLHIRPVWTPTESFWLNLIEAQFGVLRRFTLANTDDSHPRAPASPHLCLSPLPPSRARQPVKTCSNKAGTKSQAGHRDKSDAATPPAAFLR